MRLGTVLNAVFMCACWLYIKYLSCYLTAVFVFVVGYFNFVFYIDWCSRELETVWNKSRYLYVCVIWLFFHWYL